MTRENKVTVYREYMYSHSQSNVSSCSLTVQQYLYQTSAMKDFGTFALLHPIDQNSMINKATTLFSFAARISP